MTVNVILKRCGCMELRLSSTDQLVLEWLDRLSRGHAACLSAARTIASLIGRSEQTVQQALKRIEASGLVRIVRDYGLRTRRRIVLMWRQEKVAEAPPATAEIHDQVNVDFLVQESAPSSLVSEDVETKDRVSGGETVAPTVGLEPEPAPPPPLGLDLDPGSIADPPSATAPALAPSVPPPPLSDPDPLLVEDPDPKPERPKATPEQIQDLVDHAAKVLPEQPETWVKALARRFSLSWVKAALERAEVKAKAEGSVGTGYVVRTLQGFAAEGGPPAQVVRENWHQRQVRRFKEHAAKKKAERERVEREEAAKNGQG